jgi:type III secretion protein J
MSNLIKLNFKLIILIPLLCVLGCKEQLMHNLTEQQANRLMTRLDESKIDSNKKRQADGFWSVEVERSDLALAMREMQKLRLIKENTGANSEGSSVIASRDQQRFAFERALSSEIEQTLSSFDSVLEARVHLNLPQVDPLFGKIVPGAQGSGSVFIIAESGIAFSKEEIAGLVAGAAGIQASGVSVLIEIEGKDKLEVAEASIALPENLAPQYNFEALSVQMKQVLPFLVGIGMLLIGTFVLKKTLLIKSAK